MSGRAARRARSTILRILEEVKAAPRSLHGICRVCLQEIQTRWLVKGGHGYDMTEEALEAEGVPRTYWRFLLREHA